MFPRLLLLLRRLPLKSSNSMEKELDCAACGGKEVVLDGTCRNCGHTTNENEEN